MLTSSPTAHLASRAGASIEPAPIPDGCPGAFRARTTPHFVKSRASCARPPQRLAHESSRHPADGAKPGAAGWMGEPSRRPSACRDSVPSPCRARWQHASRGSSCSFHHLLWCRPAPCPCCVLHGCHRWCHGQRMDAERRSTDGAAVARLRHIHSLGDGHCGEHEHWSKALAESRCWCLVPRRGVWCPARVAQQGRNRCDPGARRDDSSAHAALAMGLVPLALWMMIWRPEQNWEKEVRLERERSRQTPEE